MSRVMESQVRLEEGVEVREEVVHDPDQGLVVTTITGQPDEPPTVPLASRLAGVLILLIIFLAFFIYAWASEMQLVTGTTSPINYASQEIWFFYLAFCTLFIVAGFGSIFTYFRYSTATAFLIPLYTVATSLIVSPVFSKFWFNVFITDFKGTEVNDGGPTRFHQISFSGLDFEVDLYNLKIALANAIAQLVVYLYIFGRINSIQMFIHSFFFNFLWNFNYFLCINLHFGSPDERIFDDYMTNVVYLFGAAYGLVAGLLTRRDSSEGKEASPRTSVQTMVGIFFLFLTFCTTTALYPSKFTPASGEYARSYIWGEGFLNCFVAMSASVIFNYCVLFILEFSARNVISLKVAIMGSISGGVMYGCVAATATNLATAVAVGLVAGLISALFYKAYLAFTSREMFFDSFGGLGFLIFAFIGGFVIAPVVLINYYDRDFYLTTLEVSTFDTRGSQLASRDIAGWVLVYVGVSLGVGLVGGLIFGGITALAGRPDLLILNDKEMFNESYGLRKDPKVRKRKMTNFEKAVVIVKNSDFNHSKLSEKETVTMGFINRNSKPEPHSSSNLLCDVQPNNINNRNEMGKQFKRRNLDATYISFPLSEEYNNNYDCRQVFYRKDLKREFACLEFCGIKGEFLQEYAHENTNRSGTIEVVVERGDRGSVEKVKDIFKMSRINVKEEDCEVVPNFSGGFPTCVESKVTLSYPFFWLNNEVSKEKKFMSVKSLKEEEANYHDPSQNMILLTGNATRYLTKDCGDQVRQSQKNLEEIGSFKCAITGKTSHGPKDGKYMSLGRMFDDEDKPIYVSEECMQRGFYEKEWFDRETAKLGHLPGMPWLRISPESAV